MARATITSFTRVSKIQPAAPGPKKRKAAAPFDHDDVQPRTTRRTAKKTRRDDGSVFAPHLAELVSLHKAFLVTVVIYMAHNGTASPIDVRDILPDITRSWGKRDVTIDDIRRCIAVQSSTKNATASPFVITAYGRNKVCVELAPRSDAAPFNEQKLCRQFEENLQALCAEAAMNEMADIDTPSAALSLEDLPKVAITDMTSIIKPHPELSKGRRALDELRSDIAGKQQERDVKQASKAALNPDGTKMSILDRLRLKQLAKASGPLPLSGPELERRAALNRVADVAATISMLSLSSPLSLRQSFTMATLVEKIKDSLRMPLSSKEGIACVRLIATEVAPEWLSVVERGGRENVVLQRNGQPVDRVLQERVRKLMQ